MVIVIVMRVCQFNLNGLGKVIIKVSWIELQTDQPLHQSTYCNRLTHPSFCSQSSILSSSLFVPGLGHKQARYLFYLKWICISIKNLVVELSIYDRSPVSYHVNTEPYKHRVWLKW